MKADFWHPTGWLNAGDRAKRPWVYAWARVPIRPLDLLVFQL